MARTAERSRDPVSESRALASPHRSTGIEPLPAALAAPSVFDEVLALKEVGGAGGRLLGLSLAHAELMARALRGALLHFASDPPPAVLSGHEPDGRPLERPHVAFLPLPSPEGPAAIRGLAIALPRDIEADDRQAILLAATRFERSGARLTLGRLGALRLARAADPEPEKALGLPLLAGPSQHWASVTPVALHENPGHLTARNPAAAACATCSAARIVADACEHIGLPRPSEVRVMRTSRFPGVPPAPAFMPYPRLGKGFQRVCVHVEMRFEELVTGPVLLGVGRYFGVGTCGVWSDSLEVGSRHERHAWNRDDEE